MTRFGCHLFAAVLTILLAAAPMTQAASTNDLPDFKEVFDLVRSHLSGMTEAELNRAAVQGLFTSLRGKVSLISGEGAESRPGSALLDKSAVLEGDVAYLRVGRVDEGLATEIGSACQHLSATN